MSVKIKINQESPAEEKRVPQTRVKLNIRKTLGGDYIVHDHYDINIVIKPDEGRIVTFGKTDTVDIDTVYDAQSRLFDFLMKKGVIDHDSIQGGNIFGSMEATLQDSDEVSTIQVAIYAISKFIEEERPYYMFRKSWEEDNLERYTNPGPEDSTELGEIPQANRKGSIDQWNTHAGRNARVYESKQRKNLEEISGIPKIDAPGISSRPETKGKYDTTKRQKDIYKKQSNGDGPGRARGQYSTDAGRFTLKKDAGISTKYHEAIHAFFDDIKQSYGEDAYEFVVRLLSKKINNSIVKEIARYLDASGNYDYMRGYSSVYDTPKGLEEVIATAFSVLNDENMRESIWGAHRFGDDRIKNLKSDWKKLLATSKAIDAEMLDIADRVISNMPGPKDRQDFINKVYKNSENKKVRQTLYLIASCWPHLAAWYLDEL